jgi:nitrogen fixation/metabolism regulation signal transduction histidine kinase
MKLGLMAKSVLGLLAIAAAPLVASALLVRQVALVAQSVSVGEAERLHAQIERDREAYVEAIEARKAAFARAADAVAARPALREACRAAADPRAALQAELARDPALIAIALVAPPRRVAEKRPETTTERLVLRQARALVEAPQCALELSYASERSAQLAEDFQALGRALAAHRHLERIRRELPPWFQLVWILVVGGFALLTTAVAIIFARRWTSRIARLVAATRRVAEGDLTTRVAAGGADELADLGHAFDHMVAELSRSRAEIDYLQKIGAWQEVARRLAHEIKNPLTPIQLAVQELHKQYPGTDARYQRTLDDARAIVGEEIANLRRLVDDFSAFAKLPRVEPRPLDLALVVADTAREAAVTLELVAPPEPVTVAGDRLLLRRVLTNLVENAAQAGAKNVRVAWSRDGARARLTIEDDGPGIPAELGARVFDPYLTTKPHGTGLGLAIAKKTVLEHGGQIELVPSSLGGAAFEIRLPGLSASPAGPSSPA